MRRFRAPHERVYDDTSTKIHWFGDSAASPIYHTSYIGTGIINLPTTQYRMNISAAGTASGGDSLFGGGDRGNRSWAAIDGSWYSAATRSSDISAALQTAWSLSFWTNGMLGTEGATCCFLEYAKGSTLDNNTLNLLGIYGSSPGLSLRWDITTATSQIIDTNVPTDGCMQIVHRVNKGATRGTLEIYRNGQLSHSTASTWFPSQTSLTSNWTMGGSGRYGNATGSTPAFVDGTSSPRLDDVVFWTRGISANKAHTIYGDGRRPWDEKSLILSGNYKTLHRVLIYSAGEWVDMSNFRNRNWCIEATIKDSAESPMKEASITLHRRLGRNLDLSRLNTQAELTYGRASEPMIDLRTKIKVEYALVPVDWAPQGWEWVECFDGLVDSLDWGSNTLEIDAGDYGLALEDVYRTDARRYEYGTAGTPSYSHLQVLLDHNAPVIQRFSSPNSVWSPGYIGGTPEVFTPVDPFWQIRYDHSPAENVLRLLGNISDQIGWDCRYRAHDPWQENRLTFSEPPRTNSHPIELIDEGPDGFAMIRFGSMPPGLQVGQTATVAFCDIAAYNVSCTVTEILDWHTVRTDMQPAGSPSVGTTGAFFYGPAYTVPLNSIREVSQVTANGDAIRNMVEIRYDRKGVAATLPFLQVQNKGASNLSIYTDPYFNTSVLVAGNDFTITGSSPLLNGVYTVVEATASNVVEITPRQESYVSLTNATGVFYSSYMQFQKAISLNTASIVKFGLRKAGVFEGATPGIDNLTEAQRLASGILSDLAYPTVDLSVGVKCAPWVDIYDLLALERDPLGRWGSGTPESPTPLTTAVVSYSHTFGEDSGTTLELRHDHPTKGIGWLRNYGVLSSGPSWAGPDSGVPVSLDVQLNTSLGQSVGFQAKKRIGKASWLQDETEYIVHTTMSEAGSRGESDGSGIIEVRGNSGVYAGSHGAPLTPGTTYYVRARAKDKFGNYSDFSATQSFVPRFTTKPAGAKGAYLSTHTVRFWESGSGDSWVAYPLVDDSTSPGYDNWGNLALWSLATCGTAQYVHLSSAAFIMPCNGDCAVEGWVGVGVISGAKTVIKSSIGLFRLDSTLPNSSGSVPVLYPRLTPATGHLAPAMVGTRGNHPGFLLGSQTTTYVPYGGTTIDAPLQTRQWYAFSEKISGNSGDRIVLGLLGEADLIPLNRSTTYSGSTSWVKFTVISQD